MKKLICCLLVLSMLIPIWGCSENEAVGSDGTSGGETPVAEYTVYDKPTFTTGTLESDLLTVQTGNFDRASRTSNGSFVEIGSGYYFQNGRAYFADRGDLTQWVLFCSAPDCNHDIGCSSSVGKIFLNDESRLYFLVPTANYTYLAGTYAKNSDYMVASMDLDGTDWKLEHILPDASMGPSGGMSTAYLTYSGYLINLVALETDGSYCIDNCIADENCGEVILADQSATIHLARTKLYMFGDTAYAVGYSRFMYCREGELIQTEKLEFPTIGSHLSGSTVRFYRTNDGYYDYDLLTGEETRIADAQVDDAAAWIIEPNCILETTLFDSSDADQRAAVRTHTMKLFDGQNWHDVTLPDNIANGRTKIEFKALTSDSIILNTPDENSSDVTFYRIALGQETYTLEQIGQFTAG